MTQDFDFERLYRSFFIVSHKDFYCLNPEEAGNFTYWVDQLIDKIFNCRINNRDLINFAISAYSHSANPAGICNSLMSKPEYRFLSNLINTAYLGNIRAYDYYRISNELKKNSVLNKYFKLYTYLRNNYYINNTINSFPPSESNYNYCLYLTLESQKDLEILHTYSRLIKK